MPREHKDHKEHKRRHSSKSNSGESGSSHKRKHRHEVAESNDESIKPPKREKESRHHHQSQVEPDEKRQKHEHRKHHKSEKSRDVKPSALSSSVKLKPLDELDILGDLSDLNDESSTKVFANHSMASASSSVKYDPLLGLTSRKQRTAVFAGSHRAATVSQVFSLEEICLRVLMENIDKLTSVGDAPFYLMKPVLAKCNPIQLSRIEDFNPHLVEECDELWKEHCRGEFRGQQPDDEEDETWRDLYFRAKEERDNKLKMLTSTIKKTTEARAAPGLCYKSDSRLSINIVLHYSS